MQTTPSTVATGPSSPLPGPRLTRAGHRLVGIGLFLGMLALGLVGVTPAFAYVAGVVLYMPLERLFQRHRQDVLRPEYGTDLLHLYLTPALTVIVGVIPAILVLLVLSPLPTLTDAVAAQPRWLQFLEVVIIGDFAGYWLHRAQHEVPFLWRFHKIHHSSRALDWLAGARSHPGGIISITAIAIVPASLVGFDPTVLGGFAAVRGLWAVLFHANVRWRMRVLDGVVVTPEFHHWHHSRHAEAVNRNYGGFLPWWDVAFGTYHLPKDRRPVSYGIDERVPAGWWGQMRHPLRRSEAA